MADEQNSGGTPIPSESAAPTGGTPIPAETPTPVAKGEIGSEATRKVLGGRAAEPTRQVREDALTPERTTDLPLSQD